MLSQTAFATADPYNTSPDTYYIKGLTCDETDNNFAAGKGITRIEKPDLLLGYPETYLGDLPPDMQCLGDITYRRGKFYLSAIGNKLVEVNMKDPSKSQVVMQFPPGTLPIHGLTTVQLGCDSVVTYAIGREYTYSKIYEVDFDNWTITEVCQVDRVVTGAGNITECALPPCDLFVDLDHDNSSLGFWGNYCANPFCLPPMAVTDTDVAILSIANTLDSLELVLTGMLNGSSEYLETSLLNSNLAVLGNGTQSLLFLNNGAASLADFEAALKSVRYQNGAPLLSYGMRHVEVTGWSGGVASILSTADLPLRLDVLKLEATATQPSCHSLPDGSIALAVQGGSPPYQYQWQLGGTDSLLTGIGAGAYEVSVVDANGCLETDTFQLLEPVALQASIAYTGLPTVCDSSGILNASGSGGTLPYTYTWSNGTVGSLNANLGPGSYVLTVLDTNGCQALDSLTIAQGDTVLVSQSAAICEGETYAWAGLSLNVDTTVCVVFPAANGCDSTVCLTLELLPLPNPEITAPGVLCGNESIALSVGPFQGYEWSTGETSNNININAPGNYSVTVTNGFGCTAVATKAIAPSSGFQFTATGPSCHGLEDGSIAVTNVTTSAPPALFSLDSLNFGENTQFDGLPGGQYWLTLLDGAGCKLVEPVFLDTPPPVLLDLGTDRMIALGTAIELEASTNLANLAYLWQPPDFLDCATCQQVVSIPLRDITYTVRATDANGCEATDSLSIRVNANNSVYAPTAFSPNGDGINDDFTLFASPAVSKIVSLEIFDRRGGLVFRANDILPNELPKGWDGNVKGKPAPTGVYVFIARLALVDGSIRQVEGEVGLVR